MVFVKRNLLGETTAQPQSGRPHKLTEQDSQVLKRVACKNSLSSVATLTAEFMLHEMGFHGRVAAHKPKITTPNAKRWLERCKARLHWTLEQWKRVLWSDESRFTIWQSDG